MALQNLRSSTPSKRPTASSMSDGQIALNTAAASAGLFFKDSNGDLVKTGPVHIGTTAPNSTPATGGSTGNSKGEAWLDTSNGNYVLKIYDGTAWRSVEIAAGSARQLLQTNAAGTDVEFTSNVDVPGTLDVTGATTLDSTASVAGLLSANGKISFAEGNSAAPGIYPGSDTDTGISSPSLNELSFSTAGTSRLYIDSSGEIGVGTTTPGYALDVRSGDGRFKRSASNAAAIYLGNTSNNYIYGDSDSNLITLGTNGTEKLRIDSSGNVGIGTSSPSSYPGKLVIAGDGTVCEHEFNSRVSSSLTNDSRGFMQVTDGNEQLHIYSPNGGDSVWEVGGTEALRIDSSGNVGIGTSSPGAPLEVQTASGERILFDSAGSSQQPRIQLIRDSGSDYAIQNSLGIFEILKNSDDIYRYASDIHQFFTAGSGERMRIDSSGNVGIGTSSPTRNLEVKTGSGIAGFKQSSSSLATTLEFLRAGAQTSTNNAIEVRTSGGLEASINYAGGGYFSSNVGIGTSSPDGTLHVNTASAGTVTPWANADDLTVENNGPTGISILAPDDQQAQIIFGTPSDNIGSIIRWKQDDNELQVSTHKTDGFLTLKTAIGQERVRIDSSGSVLIGKTADDATTPGYTFGSTGFTRIIRSNDPCLRLYRRDSNGNIVNFFRDTTNVGNISVTSIGVSYNSTSDYRLKENVVDLDGAIDRVKQLAPKRFNFIVDADTTVDGFLAHEAQTVVPEAVTGSKDEVDDDGNAVMQGIDQSKLVPLLTAALQEAIAKIETLEQRLNDAGL